MEAIATTNTASVNELCRILDVSHSAYYAWRRAESTTREKNDEELLPLIRMVFHKHRRRYGARRITEELHDDGHVCGRHRVSKMLKTQGLRAIQPKSFKDPDVWAKCETLKPDIGVMAYVTKFVPEEFLNIPTHGTIQYHPSLLPLHRGPSSINWPIINGETAEAA